LHLHHHQQHHHYHHHQHQYISYSTILVISIAIVDLYLIHTITYIPSTRLWWCSWLLPCVGNYICSWGDGKTLASLWDESKMIYDFNIWFCVSSLSRYYVKWTM
jgi:hypothetical protein